MTIRPSPLLGYNNNVRHKGKIFHIQTEDSGARYGHIMSHLFADGGRILKSVKTSYAEYIGNERMSEIVREMMKQQHKAMFIALRDGKFDAAADLIGEPAPVSTVTSPSLPRSNALEGRSSPPPPPAGRPAAIPPPLPGGSRPTDRSGSPRGVEAARAPVTPDPAPSTAPAAGGAFAVTSSASAGASAAASYPASFPPPLPPAPSEPTIPGGTPVPPAPPYSPSPPLVAREPPEELALDVGAVERAAAVDGALPAQRSSSDLPPPPSARLREKKAAANAAPATGAAAGAPPSRRNPGGPARTSERRYAPTRPASIFGQARPQHGKSIFGEDLMSDRSLDEVILNYLSDDLDDQDDE